MHYLLPTLAKASLRTHSLFFHRTVSTNTAILRGLRKSTENPRKTSFSNRELKLARNQIAKRAEKKVRSLEEELRRGRNTGSSEYTKGKWRRDSGGATPVTPRGEQRIPDWKLGRRSKLVDRRETHSRKGKSPRDRRKSDDQQNEDNTDSRIPSGNVTSNDRTGQDRKFAPRAIAPPGDQGLPGGHSQTENRHFDSNWERQSRSSDTTSNDQRRKGEDFDSRTKPYRSEQHLYRNRSFPDSKSENGRWSMNRLSSDQKASDRDSRFTARSGTGVEGDRSVLVEETDHNRGQEIPLSVPYTTPASEFLYGTSVVIAALKSRRRQLYKLYKYESENSQSGQTDEMIERLARESGVDVTKVQGEKIRIMDKMSSGRPHNGYVLEASPLPKSPVISLEAMEGKSGQFLVNLDRQSREEQNINGTNRVVKYESTSPRYPFILLLDGILDPGNLGGILRTAWFLGVDAVAISNRNSAPLRPVALKASAGAAEFIPLLSVSSPRSFLVKSKENGWKVYASMKPHMSGSKVPINQVPHFDTSNIGYPTADHPSILMIGGEGEGLSLPLQQKADFSVSIEGYRQGEAGVDSLNVSVAAGLLCKSLLRIKKVKSEL